MADSKDTKPKRFKPMADGMDPNLVKLWGDVELPDLAKSNASIRGPERANDLRDNKEPSNTWSNTERVEFEHEMPLSDGNSPRHTVACNGDESPRCKKSKTNSPNSGQEKLCKDKLDPK